MRDDHVRAERNKFRALFAEARCLFARHDLMGIWSPENPDEYDAEIGTILPRLRAAASSEDVERMLKEEFEQWFYPGCVQPPGNYKPLADDLWAAWQDHGRAAGGDSHDNP
jgi:hypothetical protein